MENVPHYARYCRHGKSGRWVLFRLEAFAAPALGLYAGIAGKGQLCAAIFAYKVERGAKAVGLCHHADENRQAADGSRAIAGLGLLREGKGKFKAGAAALAHINAQGAALRFLG